jgi:hypothetical protein
MLKTNGNWQCRKDFAGGRPFFSTRDLDTSGTYSGSADCTCTNSAADTTKGQTRTSGASSRAKTCARSCTGNATTCTSTAAG